ncbi:fluoride efflux transporter CrcB [Sinorhizobium numidicum]|uniref:Fluoride-specific ion channel FluC n=1 Tax=Sinorhizobium numidicum TaxID=680248 RepID=A0ABY8CPK2_9HYPH|nr:fluoride efflux transporter CrcB [Sinorhizobium numidicum]WEX74594.1 fluoride efflux transporter CrcB [Sinorhizobium numidicum]WEX80584.1 fluoride efflux transporter CrcB [Sinorhizobium numidicum]
MAYLIVFLGAGIGGAARHGVNQLAAHLFGVAFPFGTLSVNVAGSFVMGVLAEYFALRSGFSQEMRLFLTTGILGGFTTFSTFSLDAISLWERGEWGNAAAYVVISLVLSLAGLLAGLAIIRFLAQGQAA